MFIRVTRLKAKDASTEVYIRVTAIRAIRPKIEKGVQTTIVECLDEEYEVVETATAIIALISEMARTPGR